MNTPILFLVFKRPDTTKKVFEKIREAQPPRLYVAADGPRKNREGEAEKCEEVRHIATNVDWDCEIKTLFRDENLGCKMAVSGGIDWFFEKEEMGIILEDDCLPAPTFFQFCEKLLEKCKEDERIMHINGNNYGAVKENFFSSEYSYHFGSFPQAWGWASWKRAWQNFDREIKELDELLISGHLNKLIPNKYQRSKLVNRWKRVNGGKIDTWDFQWQFSVIANHGLTIVPKMNQISNIGFSEDATHSKEKVGYRKSDLERKKIKFPLKHPKIKVTDKRIDSLYKEYMLGPPHISKRVIIKIKTFMNRINKLYNTNAK